MKKKLLFLFCILFLSSAGFSQVAGYMGKRFIITHYSFYFPAFKQPSFRSTQGFKMNVTKALGVDIAATGRSSICFAVQYILTGISYQNAVGYNYSYIQHEEGSTIPAKLNVMQYSIGLKKFSRRSFAPIGFYMKWEMFFQQYIIKYDPLDFYTYGSDGYYYSPQYRALDGGSGLVKMKGIGSAFSIGKQRIFWDKIVVDYGIRASLSAPLPYRFANAVESSMAAKAYDRVLNNQLLNVKLGIGFLAF